MERFEKSSACPTPGTAAPEREYSSFVRYPAATMPRKGQCLQWYRHLQALALAGRVKPASGVNHRPEPRVPGTSTGCSSLPPFPISKALQETSFQSNKGGGCLSRQTEQHHEQGETRAKSSRFPVSVFVLPLCLAKYRPKMMSRQSIANTTTATTPPTTAWSTLRIAPSSPARESVEIRRGIRIRDLLRCAPKGLAAAALRIGKATLALSKGRGVKHGAI